MRKSFIVAIVFAIGAFSGIASASKVQFSQNELQAYCDQKGGYFVTHDAHMYQCRIGSGKSAVTISCYSGNCLMTHTLVYTKPSSTHGPVVGSGQAPSSTLGNADGKNAAKTSAPGNTSGTNTTFAGASTTTKSTSNSAKKTLIDTDSALQNTGQNFQARGRAPLQAR